MNAPVLLERRAGSRLTRSAVPAAAVSRPAAEAGRRLQLSTPELAFRIFAAFRAHPHINNVLTHVSRADWRGVERALNAILDPATTTEGLSPLAQNVIDLMCAERGVTGRIVKPYFHGVLNRLLEPSRAERLIFNVEALFLELEWQAQHPAPAAPATDAPT